MTDQKRLRVKIQGRVQGVGFRWFAREAASALGLTGYVRNTYDGDVEVVAEGNEGLLARYLGLLRRGPTSAVVTQVDETWGTPTGEYDAFYVKR